MLFLQPFVFLLLAVAQCFHTPATKEKLTFFKANNPYIQYTGRIDFSNPEQPRFWAPGVYIQAKFKGTTCIVSINDEVLYGTSHNYIEYVVDDREPVRIQTTGKINEITIAKDLKDTEHTVTICKNTEAGIGYLELVGIICNQLLPLPPKPVHQIEFIGNSITCGMGSDLSQVPCGKGQWYDEHNAYFSYGPITARALSAQWHLSAVSGIGLVHSCCDMKITMPQVFDKINMREDSIAWNFKNYVPDVVTICLGQNDGVQDSTLFCSQYISFLHRLRGYYPKAQLVCLTSPMGDARLTAVLKNYLTSIVKNCSVTDKKVSAYFFSKQFNHGCGSHPDLQEHKEIAAELTAYLKKLTGW